MKKISLLLVIICTVLIACSSKEKKNDKVINVGIIQVVEHESLDTIRNGFISQLEKEGYKDGENIKISYNNAQGDKANLKTIAAKLKSESDIVLAIATPSAQAMVAETTSIPIIFAAVTDPVDAGLIKSFDKPGGNVTGVSDMVDITKVITLLNKIKDNKLKVLGIIYDASEANSKSQVDLAKKAAKDNNISIKEVTVASSNDIKSATESIIKKVDGIFVPNDNTVASGMITVGKIAKDNNVPVIVAAKEQAEAGALVSYGLNQKSIGEQTAKIFTKAIKNDFKLNDMPAQKANEMELFFNKKMSSAFKIDEGKIKDYVDTSLK